MKNIFVSSTFADFNTERDILRENVMSRLNQIALQYGEYVSFSDLRWGIDTSDMKEEEITDKVLSSCLDEIDRTRPYMVIMLGDRYGYIPERNSLMSEIDRKQLVLEDLEISVTHLEIEYGAFNRGDVNHIYAYFREPVIESCSKKGTYSAEEVALQRKLGALKNRLKKLLGNHVHTYSSTDVQNGAFADMVFSDLSKDFNQEWAKIEKMPVFQKEISVEMQAVKEKSSFFLAFAQFASDIQAKICTSDHKKIALVGESGSGKSTIFSFLTTLLINKGWDVIPFLSGCTVASTDEKLIAKTIIWKLEKILNLSNRYIYEEDRTILEIKDYLETLYELYEQTGRNLFIGVDAIEQIATDDNQNPLWFFPEKQYNNIRVVVTTWKEELIYDVDYELFRLPALSSEEQLNVINGILRRNGKKLSNAVINEIIRMPVASNPLMLYLIVNRLCLMNSSDYSKVYNKGGGIEEIIRQQLHIIQNLPQNTEEMSHHILTFMSEILCVPQALEAMYMIASSRYGLRYNDLYEILKNKSIELLPLQFAQYINLIFDLFFIRDDGRIDFMHQKFRASLRCSSAIGNDGYIARYLLGLPRNDIVRKEEIIYHLITADMEEELVREISEDYQAYNKDAARDIYQMTNTMPDYILSVLKNQFARNGITDALIDFLNYYINNVSDLSKNSLGSIERELVRLDHISAWLKDTMPHHENNELYLRLQYSYIWICLANGRHNMEKHTDEAYAEALKFYDIAINLAKELYDTDPSSFATMELGIAFYEKAIILGRLGGKANEEKAIEMNRNACKMAQISIKKQGYVSYSDLRNYILFNRSLVNELIDKHNEAHTLEALKLLQAAIVTVNGLLDEQNMPLEILAEYAKLYHSLGNCYSNIDNTDFINKGIDSYKKGFNLTKQCYLAMGNKEHLYDISVSCISLAKAYRKAGNKESLMKGFAYAEDAVKYSKRGLFEYNLADYIHLYGKALSLYAELAGEIGDPSLLVKGKESLNEAFGLISEDSGVPVIERIFLIEDLIRGITWISAESQDKDYLKKALSLAASIKAKYDAEYIKNNYDSKLAHSLSDIYDVAASACQTLGDLKTIEKGIEFATESLEITKIIIESEENSIFLQRYLELSLLKMGTLMGAAGKDIDEILHYMEQGLAIAEKLAVLSDTYEKQSDYGFALMRNAEALLLKNDKDLLIKAQEYVSKAIEIRTKLLEQRNTAHQYEELINSYLTSSSICLRLGDESNAKSVLDKSACVLKEAVDKGSTPKLQIGQGDYEVSFAEFLEQTGKLEESIKYYESASYHYSSAASQIGTFYVYRKYLSALLRTGKAYAKSRQLNETLKYIRIAVLESKKYIGLEEQYDYKLMMVDLYMSAEPILNELIDRGEEPAKIYDVLIDMYKESIGIYLQILISNKTDIRLASNLSALFIGLARIFYKDNREDEAIEYYTLCSTLTESYGDKAKTSYTMITNRYRSYAEKGWIYFDKDRNQDALYVLYKAVDLAADALKLFKKDQEVIDICDDIQECATQAAKIALILDNYNKAAYCISFAIQSINKLQSFGLTSEYESTYAELQKMLFVLNIKSKWSQGNEFHRTDEKLQKMYDKAETCMHSDEIESKKMFMEFIEAESAFPDEKKSDQTLVYSYNAWHQMYVIELHTGGEQGFSEALEYCLKTVQRELEVLKLPAAKERTMEIVTDLSQDALKGLHMSWQVRDNKKAELFMNALMLAKNMEL